MTAFQKSRFFIMAYFIFLSGSVLAGLDNALETRVISLSYLEKELFKGTITVECSSHDNVCHYKFEPHLNDVYQNNGSTLPPLKDLKFEGHIHHDPGSSTDLGSIAVRKDDRETKLPLSINFDELQLGEKDNPLTRAVITQLHPALIVHAYKELNDTAELSDYLTGETKNSETLHLFQPEEHVLPAKDTDYLKTAFHEDFIILDIGDSYSMVILFDNENIPSSVHILDRWKLYRDPAFKTLIGYGDLVGLVLHLFGAAHHLGLPGNGHGHGHGHIPPPANLTTRQVAWNKLASSIGAAFHIAEIVDHAHGVGEFIGGVQKHYHDHDHDHDHDHGVSGEVFGVMHLFHTFYELATQHDPMHRIQNSIQTLLTVASFGYHHVPHYVYEYSMAEVLRPVIAREKKRATDATNHFN